MGCGGSTSSEPEKKVPPPVICKGMFATKGYHGGASKLSKKITPSSLIKVNCGSLYVKPHIDTKVDCLLFYPDPRGMAKDATRLVADRVLRDATGPTWGKGARIQVKEFDSLDDIYKDWYESPGPGQVPGVHLIEDAGPLGAWVSFSPNSYQTRFLTPEGRRMWSPMADAGHQHISVPQRVFHVYREQGEQAILSLCTRLSKALVILQTKLIKIGTPSILTDLVFDPTESVKNLMAEFGKMEHYHTVFEFPECLHALRDILSEMEDNLIYNWFDVSLDCNLQIGTYRFHRSKKAMSRHRTLLDRALGWGLDNLNDGTDAVLVELREEVKERFNELSSRWIKPKEDNEGDDDDQGTLPDDEGDNLIKCLFPDLEELIDATIASIDGEVMGIVEELPENSANPNVEEAGGILKLLKQWKTEDEEPVEQRREAFYNKSVDRLQPQLKAFNVPGLTDPDSLNSRDRRILDRIARFPLILPKHFYEFTFFLVFPKWDPEEQDDMLCPKEAFLISWPEGTAASEAGAMQKVQMTPITVPNGGPDTITTSAQSFANRMFQDGDGDSSIDSDDDSTDPRKNWVPYPTHEWRGYECTATLATHVTYNFHFLLDDHIFLDHDTYSKDPNGESGDCRRVRFEDACRPYTVNPLKYTGLIL